MFDFDRVIERRGTHATKWDNIAKLSGIDAPDAIPMWVADMDFAAPPGVTEALAAENRRAVHGYYADTGSWAAALADWMARRHGLRVDPSWVSPTPGVVSGLGLILQAVSAPGDEVVVFPPAYHAFRRIITANDRRILDAQLVETDGRYVMDLDALNAKLTPRTKVVFFCSPHNPGGTVWTPDEIRALAAFCATHDLILVSDEIHCDLVFKGARHTPTLVAAPEIADRLITCVAATKTFNLAGAHVGACVTSNAELKRRLDARIQASGLASYNSFGMIATEAAWRTGDAWLDALVAGHHAVDLSHLVAELVDGGTKLDKVQFRSRQEANAAKPPGRSLMVAVKRAKRPSAARPFSITRPRTASDAGIPITAAERRTRVPGANFIRSSAARV